MQLRRQVVEEEGDPDVHGALVTTHKMALFEAYGTLCGDAGVTLLDGMLNARGLFGRKEDPELRACAAMALGRVGSDAAIATLRRASTEKDILVRNAVNRALRGGTA